MAPDATLLQAAQAGVYLRFHVLLSAEHQLLAQTHRYRSA